jgi:hypothetical protein
MATPCTLLLKPPGTTIPVSLPDAVPDTTRLGATRAMTRTIVMAPAVEASALRDGAVYAEAVLTCPRNVSDFTNVALSVRAAPPGGLALTLLYEKVAVTSK